MIDSYILYGLFFRMDPARFILNLPNVFFISSEAGESMEELCIFISACDPDGSTLLSPSLFLLQKHFFALILQNPHLMLKFLIMYSLRLLSEKFI
jgi:hypothetical protein